MYIWWASLNAPALAASRLNPDYTERPIFTMDLAEKGLLLQLKRLRSISFPDSPGTAGFRS